MQGAQYLQEFANNEGVKKGDVKCYYCNEPDHYANECPLRDDAEIRKAKSHFMNKETNGGAEEEDEEIVMLYCYHTKDEEIYDENTILWRYPSSGIQRS